MFITAGSGGVELNLTVTSIVVQLEVWWNVNNEKLAWCRAFRQGQDDDVCVIRLQAANSCLEAYMENVQI